MQPLRLPSLPTSRLYLCTRKSQSRLELRLPSTCPPLGKAHLKVCIILRSISARFSGEIGFCFTSVEGNLGDRKDLNLLGNGERLIKAVAAVNNNTIVVIHSVGSIVMESWADLPGVKAIFMAGLPGEQTGQSRSTNSRKLCNQENCVLRQINSVGPGIADVLFGKVKWVLPGIFERHSLMTFCSRMDLALLGDFHILLPGRRKILGSRSYHRRWWMGSPQQWYTQRLVT